MKAFNMCQIYYRNLFVSISKYYAFCLTVRRVSNLLHTSHMPPYHSKIPFLSILFSFYFLFLRVRFLVCYPFGLIRAQYLTLNEFSTLLSANSNHYAGGIYKCNKTKIKMFFFTHLLLGQNVCAVGIIYAIVHVHLLFIQLSFPPCIAHSPWPPALMPLSAAATSNIQIVVLLLLCSIVFVVVIAIASVVVHLFPRKPFSVDCEYRNRFFFSI